MKHPMNKDFVAYDYQDVAVEQSLSSLYRDAYENFGWELDGQMEMVSVQGKVNLHFRRNRKIVNKVELTRLQRNFDACMEEIQTLEASKRSGPASVAIIIGILGTACMAGAVFAVTAEPPFVSLCILLSIPGFLGWALPWFVYQHLVKKRTQKLTPILNNKYEELYEVCEKGSRLLL